MGESSPSFPSVKKGVADLKRSCLFICDDYPSGRPKTTTTDKNIEKIDSVILNVWRVKIRELADVVKISTDRIHSND